MQVVERPTKWASTSHEQRPTHLFLLDALRGVAALVVVLYHTHHFYFRGADASGVNHASQPFASIFGEIYERGYIAVDLFFVLSGFVFYWLYSERLSSRSITFWDFAVLRLSRLYPLHFLTLLAVAALQAVYRSQHGFNFAGEATSWSAVPLHLGFASSWLPGVRNAFNIPIWSVSIEVLLYGIFFFLCCGGFVRAGQMVVMIALGLALPRFGFELLGRGVFGFFSGGLAYYGWLLLRDSNSTTRLVVLSLLWVAVVSGFVNWTEDEARLVYRIYHAIPASDWLQIKGRDVIGGFLLLLPPYSVLFPLIVITLAILESAFSRPWAWLAPLGQLSYSSYLLHFPLQIAFAIACASLMKTGIGVVLFFTALIPLSWLSFQYFELPIQQHIRRHFLAGHWRRSAALAQPSPSVVKP